MVTNLSSLDIFFLVPELKELINSKIEKIFQTNNDLDFIFALHQASVGKKLLYISLPNIICISDFKINFPDIPPSFCSSLRRKITNAKIINISQVGFERIIEITLSTKHGEAKLYIELFSTGNMILVDSENKILAVAKPQIWENRSLKTNEIYKFPPAQTNIFELTESNFKEILKSSNKESIVKSLAIDLSLGGIFAEEILFNLKINKSNKIDTISDSEIEKIYTSILNLKNIKLKPFTCEHSFYPFELNILEKETKQYTETFSEAINKTVFENYIQQEKNKTESIKKQSISKLDKVITSQSIQLKGLDKSQEENQIKGELLYKYYNEIKQILDYITQNKKTLSWQEIKTKLSENKLFVSLDEHNGAIELNLE